MADGWQHDKQWSDRFMPEIKGHLGRALFTESTISQDQREATDLVVLRASGFAVGCRVRKYEFYERYPDEFTLRWARPSSGYTSEVTKIVDGWCDFLFYGFSDRDELRLCSWVILDCARLRAAWIRHPELLRSNSELANRDGSSTFKAWRLSDYPPDVIVQRDRERDYLRDARARYDDAQLNEYIRGAVAMNGPIQLPLEERSE